MELQLLRAFLAVAEQGGVSQAADRLHVTQPAVSKRLASLEEQLGTRLFDRIGRNLHLTGAGQALLPRARQILDEVADAEREIHNLATRVEGKLRIATSHHVGLHHMPPILKAFSNRYPKVTLDIDFLDSEQAYEAMTLGKYELAVVTLALQDYPTIEAQLVWPDPCQVVVAPDHPLAAESRITLQQLAEYPAILPDLKTYTGRLIKQLFDERGLRLKAKLATNYLETCKMMVSVGLGWSVLPETLADDSLKVLRSPQIEVTRSLGVIRHRERTLSNAGNALLELIMGYGAQNSGQQR